MPFPVKVRRNLGDPEYYVEYLTGTNVWWSLEPICTIKEARACKKKLKETYKKVRIIKRTSQLEVVE